MAQYIWVVKSSNRNGNISRGMVLKKLKKKIKRSTLERARKIAERAKRKKVKE